MDSVSQFALGAAVGLAAMGRRTAPWKAALLGGVVGTLPDLDALVDYGDAVSNMTMHRAETHSIFWQSVASPFIAAAVAGVDRAGPRFTERFARWWGAVWLVLVTHALLDATTVYGTQLALPFSNHPFGLGSVFIVDPLYTLPLLFGIAAALLARGPGRLRWNRIGLALSTAYLGWALLAQTHVTGIVREQLAERGMRPERVLVTPAPFNTVLWRVVAMYPDGYDEGFYSLLDRGRDIRFDRFSRDAALYAETAAIPAVASVAWISRGFFRMREHDGRLTITDLRMGQEPFYVFSFEVARRASPLAEVKPIRVGSRDGMDAGHRFGWLGQVGRMSGWLGRRLLGEDLPPPR
ncbi:metal-dependent hydrolase [Burkholderiaceae bacterium FT117]|uniref:metal-dependent hydrolase n=1 Tax=Zeimonas sediminis TaxID=2944268 RepID=UPI0023430262|nr:metal-dependent hydrolase [Zeimonas sediminis]MCM5570462.1 metal-dependent hydrolase [Zeimonas sediminis]